MLKYIIRRVLGMIPTLFLVSIIVFIIIQLPPGDYLSNYIMAQTQEGDVVDAAEIAALRARYGLDRPMYIQYFNWAISVAKGDFGYSFQWSRPVNQVIWPRLGMTLIVSISSLLFSWIIAFPIGFLSAVKQHSIVDYSFTFIGFIGLATPNFVLALIFMYLSLKYFGSSVGGLFSPEYMDAAWSFSKFMDLLQHLWIPMVIVGTAGTAGLIRILRNNLLDELQKPYVVTARAKGLSETKLVFKYPVRLALNPFVSSVGFILPSLISGSTITAVVLNLPTAGPVLLNALLNQDMYLAGSFTMLLAVLTLIGVLISDILLAALDPRIRYN